MDIGIEMDMNEERKHFLEKQQDDGHGNDTSASCTRRSSSTGHRGSSVDLGVGDEDNELRKLQAEQNRPRQMCRFSENERVRNIAAFWILGLLNNYGYVVMLSAAKDIDEKMAGLVLFADIIPTVLIKVTAPFWVHYLSYRLRITLCGLSALASFYLVALSPSLGMKLLGVVLASIGAGWGEVTFLAYSSFYDKTVITYWSSGTGFAGIAGAGWYLLFRDIFNVSAKLTLELAGFFPLLYILTFFFLLSKSLLLEREAEARRTSDCDEPNRSAQETEQQSLVPHAGKTSDSTDNEEAGYAAEGTPDIQAKVQSFTANMTCKERLKAVVPLLQYMAPLCIVYFAEYLINTGVNSEISFCNGMSTKTFYVYASFIYQIGVFLSRSSGSVIKLRKLWPLPVLQMLTLAYFIIQAMTNLIPIQEIVLLVVFWEGLLGGACYVNAFRRIAEDVSPELKEFSLGVASIADSFGIAAASIVAIGIESGLRDFREDRDLPCKGGVS